MADIILRGYVQEDGRVIVEDKVDLPPGEIRLVVQPRRTRSISLAEAKRRLAEPRKELTPDQEAKLDQLYAELSHDTGIESGLPDDFGDEIDHYLYGTPKRSED